MSLKRTALTISAVGLIVLAFSALMLSSNPAQASGSLPDWSEAGYRGTGNLPGSGDITSNATCIITSSEIQASPYNVIPNDSSDDCSGSFTNLSLIELPSGTINTSTEIHVDVDYLIIRGQGNNPNNSSATKIEFEPGSDTVYDGISDFVLNDMTDSGGGNGGWIWPGRGAFRVQTRAIASSYNSAYSSAPANRKDFYEGSVNFHWKGGIELDQNSLAGDTVLELDRVSGISVGDYVWVGAANSHKMYDEQGVQSGDRIRGHMRQQIFQVSAVNSSADTITIDKPLEFDLYINSTADGSAEISGSGSSNKSKVIPLDVVEGVGFENFYLTQIVPGHSPSEAAFNYNNIAKERAMHGFVFKWVVNSYVSNVRTYMTGSHPIVTEMAKNLQFDSNTLEGSWNKGKGGNGYFRNSKLWDSLIVDNTTIGLRHLTLQWSASGNVVSGNEIDSDLNLHGGWERNNLIENNTIEIPFNHRDCNPNCSGGEGTWYPIWGAAGHHAGGWSGATGPRNVFYNNDLSKQLTSGGSYTNYTPYHNSNTIYQFGWDSAVTGGSQWEHLALNGTDIETWTHNETEAFYSSPNAGINDDCTYSGSSLVGASITCGGTPQPTATATSAETATPTVAATPTATVAATATVAPTATPSGSANISVDAKMTKDEADKAQYDVKVINDGSSGFTGFGFRFYIDISEIVSAGHSFSDLRCNENYDPSGSASCSFVQVSGNLVYVDIDFGSYTLPANDDVRYKFMLRLDGWEDDWDSSNDYSRAGLTSSYQTTTKIPVF